MTAARKIDLVSIDEYLEGELTSPVKHEYLGGVAYAMAGATNVHNAIATNFIIATGSQLRGRPGRVFNSDTKLRVRLTTQTRFYYPDGMIVCRPNTPGDTFQDYPAVVAEVLSDGTRRTDEGEKKDAYLTIPTLTAYVLIETDRPRVIVHRRAADGAGFAAELYEGADALIAFDDVGCSLRLADLYDRVDFGAAASDPGA